MSTEILSVDPTITGVDGVTGSVLLRRLGPTTVVIDPTPDLRRTALYCGPTPIVPQLWLEYEFDGWNVDPTRSTLARADLWPLAPSPHQTDRVVRAVVRALEHLEGQP